MLFILKFSRPTATGKGVISQFAAHSLAGENFLNHGHIES